MERNTRTKAEREYIKGIIQNLSLQRLTDQQIVDYLHDEKQIEIGRSTVTITRNQIEKQAERWYIDLRNSAYKYLAAYKQRIDSLLSYQRTLHDIISNTKKDEVKIRAISELHSIEMDIFSLWKQLPASNIVNTVDNTENEKKVPWAVQIGGGGAEEENKIPKAIALAHGIPGIDDEDEQPIVGYESEPWNLDNNHNVNIDNPNTLPKANSSKPIPDAIPETIVSTLTKDNITSDNLAESANMEHENAQTENEEPEQEQKPNDVVDIDILGRWPKPFDVQPWVQCKFNNSNCNKWFKTKEIRNKHIAKYHT